MANPVGFEGAGDVLSGEGIENCSDLPIFRCQAGMISCWRFSEEELKIIAETGVVWMMIHGHQMCPVSIQAPALVEVDGRPAKAEPLLIRQVKEAE